MRSCLAPLLAGALLLGAATVRGADAPRPKIAVIPKGTTHVFWKSVEVGARDAGLKLGVEILWKGPLKENDRAQQIAIVEQFVSEGVAGIVLAPLDDTALRRPVAMAMAKNIPVVIFDSALKGDAGKDFVSLVATDNRKGGLMGGEKLADLLAGKGKVSLLRYQVGSASTDEREAGFLAAIARRPDLQVIVDNRYAGPTMGEAKTAAMNMIDKLRESDGVFTPNESSTFGMLLALRQNNLAGKIRFVGFDTSPVLLDALRKGEIHALVAQDPWKMGSLGVQTLVAHLKGEKVETLVDTGVALVTPENIDTPDIRKVIQLP